jgi:hypothetical protein
MQIRDPVNLLGFFSEPDALAAHLEAWMHFDPFMRFILTIGAEKAFHIKSICIEGNIRNHHCDEGICQHGCSEDIGPCIRLYGPLMQEFLPKLQHFIILAEPDCVDRSKLRPLERYKEDIAFISTNQVERALDTLLLRDLRTLPSLQRLEVLDTDNEQKRGRRAPWAWAEKHVAWFKNRGLMADARKKSSEIERASATVRDKPDCLLM